jgi:hypothetical protein
MMKVYRLIEFRFKDWCVLVLGVLRRIFESPVFGSGKSKLI